MPIEGISRFCFAASYLVALLMELLQLFWPRPLHRIVGLAFGAAGLFAQTAYLLVHQPSPATAVGSLLLLAWVIAIFYLYGTIHYRKTSWAVFVLPLILTLLALAELPSASSPEGWNISRFWNHFWGVLHGVLLLLASVGVTVGFIASTMYLVQARRLQQKRIPNADGLRLLSLERLETMNRRAINFAFPLLTAGLLVGLVLMLGLPQSSSSWLSPKIVGTAGLWVVFIILLYLRYGAHLPARRLALVTIAAFMILLVTLVAAHPFAQPSLTPTE
jgi:ABC-type transport system involved in cytochrome c biogenesis permease subunit